MSDEPKHPTDVQPEAEDVEGLADSSQDSPADPPVKLNLNTASLEELTQISGIGTTTAERIIARRPYSSIDELTEVQGINTAVLESIRPALMLPPEEAETGQAGEEQDTSTPVESETPAPTDLPLETYPEEMFSEEKLSQESSAETAAVEAEIPETEVSKPEAEVAETDLEVAAGKPESVIETGPSVEAEVSEATPQPVGQAQAGPAAPPAAPQPPRSLSAADALWIAIGSGLISLILAVALTLGILSAVNGGLRYASPSDLGEVERQVSGLNSQAEILQNDISGLRERLNNLEALSGRVTQVEQAAEALQTGLDDTQQSVEALSGQVEDLSNGLTAVEAEIETIRESTTRFNRFLGGLSDLLGTLSLPTPEATPAPGGK